MVMKIDRNAILNSVDEDKLFEIRKVIDKIEISANRHSIQSTDFLDPYERKIVISILNKFDDISYSIDGGYSNSERAVIYIFPNYMYDIDFDDVEVLSFKNNFEFTHKDVLGSILSLGIDRRKVGDIVFNSNYCHIFVKSEIFKYLRFNLGKVKRNNIKFEKAEFIEPTLTYDEYTFIISSLRLDTFLSSVLKLSRTAASNLIESDKVKVNFRKESKGSNKVNIGDLISVRGFGRIFFDNIEGYTRKDRYIVKVKIPK
ncbi:S4 domain protein [Peptoniphilus sp. oral taxon 386 str. F0131]|nr:S4 domain protein [Peptoniphilus sp. oral taxon 386 str. F0131]